MAEFNFATESTRFECTRCASCCSLDVLLSDRELHELGKDADMKWRTTRKVMAGSGLVCCLLQLHSCSVYGSRPKLCRVYPFFALAVAELELFHIEIPGTAVRVRGEDGEEYVLTYDDRCPGIGHGRTNDWSEIVSTVLSHLKEFKATP
jgi:Fe-S-cluster containining protein